MLLATGFPESCLEIFESYQTAIDMVATSEVGVSMSIDNSAHLNDIVDELKKYGTVTVDIGDMCINMCRGDLDWSNVGFETLATDAMKDIPRAYDFIRRQQLQHIVPYPRSRQEESFAEPRKATHYLINKTMKELIEKV